MRSGKVTRRCAKSLLLGSEPFRAAGELAAAALSTPFLLTRARGDGHCVVVLPGFMAGDANTVALRRYVSLLGYEVHGWGNRTNRGATTRNVAALRALVARLARSSGRPVTVIGWSLGGHFAYQLARADPRHVRQVITLGSPARLRWPSSQVGSRLADRIPSSLARAPGLARPWDGPGSLRVPVTAIYSRADGVVDWRSCLVPKAHRRENVQVHGSHLGLAHNPAALHVIADRLAQDPGRWAPFRPGRGVGSFFPGQPGRA